MKEYRALYLLPDGMRLNTKVVLPDIMTVDDIVAALEHVSGYPEAKMVEIIECPLDNVSISIWRAE